MITATKLFLTLVHTFSVEPQLASTLTCIAIHESSLNTQAINFNTNGTVDYGLFQINSVHLPELNIPSTKLLIPHINIKVALYVYRKQGIKAWAVWKKCV